MRSTLSELAGQRILMVASTGGHLTQLTRLESAIGVAEDSPWVTFDTGQSRSLLAGREVYFVPYVAPRDLRGIVQAALRTWAPARDVNGAVSTGAGLALAVLPEMAVATRKPVVFIESISRVNGPSLTGRMLRGVPRVGLYAQHAGWCRNPWRLGPSVLSEYAVVPAARPVEPRRMLVTLGSIQPYRFDRLVDVALQFARRNPHLEVTWQLGATRRTNLPGRVISLLSDAEFSREIALADLVVAHAGVGVAMNVLDRGKVPLLLARRPDLNEHVDPHQEEIYHFLMLRGLAVDAEEALQGGPGLNRALASEVNLRSAATQRA